MSWLTIFLLQTGVNAVEAFLTGHAGLGPVFKGKAQVLIAAAADFFTVASHPSL